MGLAGGKYFIKIIFDIAGIAWKKIAGSLKKTISSYHQAPDFTQIVLKNVDNVTFNEIEWELVNGFIRIACYVSQFN